MLLCSRYCFCGSSIFTIFIIFIIDTFCPRQYLTTLNLVEYIKRPTTTQGCRSFLTLLVCVFDELSFLSPPHGGIGGAPTSSLQAHKSNRHLTS